MGTEKYPIENSYSEFLNTHGGSSNAYTASEDTVYYFDIISSKFEDALDMFSSFFICPLFASTSVDREINAVDSENSKNVLVDGWRTNQLMKSMARDDHPFGNFGTGNLETLKTKPESEGLNIRDIVIQHYKKYYSSNVMTLCLYGAESLDSLEKMAIEKFTPIQNSNTSIPKYDSRPFNELAKLIQYVPVKDLKSVDITFLLPSVTELYMTKPCGYICHLIGHESEGSILSYLKRLRLANGLSSWVDSSHNDFAFLSISIELTSEGVENVDEVVSTVFSYIRLLLREGSKQWIFEELKHTTELSFTFRSVSDPIDEVVRYCTGMHIYRPEHYLVGERVYLDISVQSPMSFLEMLKPSNCIIIVKSKSFEGKTSLKEKWYGSDYNELKFTSDQMTKWNDAVNGTTPNPLLNLYLPEKNPFIPESLAIYSNVDDISGKLALHELIRSPHHLINSFTERNSLVVCPNDDTQRTISEVTVPRYGKIISCYYLLDNVFKFPKANILVNLESFFCISNPHAVICTDMYCNILKELLSEYSYYADCAGLQYNIALAKFGLELTFTGYNDKLGTLVEKVLQTIKTMNISVSDALFDRVKEKLLRETKNYLKNQPYYHTTINSLLCLEEGGRYSGADKYYALKEVTLNEFQAFSTIFLRSVSVELLTHGNITENDAKTIVNLFNEILDIKPTSLAPIRRCVDLAQGIEYIYREYAKILNPEEVNSAVENIYFIGKMSVNNESTTSNLYREALTILAVQILNEAAFDQLRTKEQLGYICFTGIKKVDPYFGLQIILQSSHANPNYLNERIESFLTNYRADISTMKEESFEQHKTAVIEQLSETPKNLNRESKKYWSEISSKMYNFERTYLLVNLLRSVTLVQFIDFYDTFILSISKRKKFSSQYFGKLATDLGDTVKENVHIIKDPISFKKTQPLMS